MKKIISVIILTVMITITAFVPATKQVEAAGSTWTDFMNGSTAYYAKEMANDTYSGAVSSIGGSSAYRIELRSSDPIVCGSKRSEIRERKCDVAASDYTYTWSMYLPEGGTEDYAIDPKGSEIITQWHNQPDPGEEWTSPPVALHTGWYYNDPDHYTLEVNYDPGTMSTNDTLIRNTYDLGSFTQDKGSWVNWKAHIKWGWEASQDPIIEIYKNGTKIFETTQPNTTNDQNGTYMKMGVYKWDWAQTGTANKSILNTRVIYFKDASTTLNPTVPAVDNQAVAQIVIDQITALPDVVTEANQATVIAARTAYDALTDSQKALVTNYNKLTNAEATLQAIADNTAQAQAAADDTAAQAVVDQISALPATITTADESSVTAARDAYNSLTDSQKALVTNYSNLTDAEATLIAIAADAAAQAQAAADKAAAQAVIDQIDTLPATVTAADESSVVTARTMYNGLTSTQKDLVANYSKLTDAEAVLKDIVDQAAAQKVIDQINALPKTVTATDKTAVEAARSAYNALTSSQKALVNNYSILTADEKALASLKTTPVQNVINLISAFPTTITLEDKTAIETARSAYNALTSKQKTQVTNYKKLTAAEKTLTSLQASKKSSDATLSNLTFSNVTATQDFSSDITSYSASVDKQTSSTLVTPVVNDSNATVSVNGKKVSSGSPANVSLKTGKNTIKIVVTAENKKTKTYTMNVTRAKK